MERCLETHLQPVLPPIPLHRSCQELAVKRNVIEATESTLVTTQANFILPRFLDSYPVVCVTFGRVEVKDEEKSGAFVDDNFVTFVLQ